MLQRMRLRAPDMVEVPAGTFTMGSTPAQIAAAAREWGLAEEALRDETPQQTIALDTFFISRSPITCADYRAFLIATDHMPPASWATDEPATELLNHPVVDVSLADARMYCRWLSTAMQRDFVLPEEAQWEKAARGDDGRSFPWGDTWQAGRCHTADAGVGATVAVGSYAQDRSPYGCVDMAGNVAEWVLTRYRPYPGGTLAVSTPQTALVRGGHWAGGGDLARCARRQPADGTPRPHIGFRVISVEAEPR